MNIEYFKLMLKLYHFCIFKSRLFHSLRRFFRKNLQICLKKSSDNDIIIVYVKNLTNGGYKNGKEQTERCS